MFIVKKTSTIQNIEFWCKLILDNLTAKNNFVKFCKKTIILKKQTNIFSLPVIRYYEKSSRPI